MKLYYSLAACATLAQAGTIQFPENTCIANPRLTNAKCNNPYVPTWTKTYYGYSDAPGIYSAENAINGRHSLSACNNNSWDGYLAKCRHNWSSGSGYVAGEEKQGRLSIDMTNDIIYSVDEIHIYATNGGYTIDRERMDVFVQQDGEQEWEKCTEVGKSGSTSTKNLVIMYDCFGAEANRIKVEKQESVSGWAWLEMRELNFIGEAVYDEPEPEPKQAKVFQKLVPTDYFSYVAKDTTPVCKKHYEKTRLCNLFLSCFPELFQSGITGNKHCDATCNAFTQNFPRQMCASHHWNQHPALLKKFTIDEDNMQVCYNKNNKVGNQCVTVDAFVDIANNDQGTKLDSYL